MRTLLLLLALTIAAPHLAAQERHSADQAREAAERLASKASAEERAAARADARAADPRHQARLARAERASRARDSLRQAFEARRAELRAEPDARVQSAPPRAHYELTADGRGRYTPETAAWVAERLAASRAAARRAAPPPGRTVRGPRPTPAPARASAAGVVTYTVDSTFDEEDVSVGDGVCANLFGECTLRAAIQEARVTPEPDPVHIAFAIPTSDPGYDAAADVWTIRVNFDDGFGAFGRLPLADRPNLTIDGLTQPGASCGSLVDGTPHGLKVTLDGGLTDPLAFGIDSITPDFTVRGLVIQNFPATAISPGGDRTLVECNYVGTDAAGQTAQPNGDGILIGSLVRFFAGVTPSDVIVRNNLVAGNALTGLSLYAENSLVQDNLVGTNAAGDAPLGNGGVGIYVVSTDSDIEGNVVSANASDGIGLYGDPGVSDLAMARATLTDNIVGLSRTGADLGLGNGRHGIAVIDLDPAALDGPSDNDLGLPGQGNLIGANAGSGVWLSGARTRDNRVRANTVGLDAAGSAAPNAEGVLVTDSARPNVIGGAGSGDGNVIAGNLADGVAITSTGNRVVGNTIGLNAAGSPRANFAGVYLGSVADVEIRSNVVSGNASDGILLDGIGGGHVIAENRIGTSPDGLGFDGNGGDGIAIGNHTDVAITGNTIAGNVGEGIAVRTDTFGGDPIRIDGNRIGVGSDGATSLENGLNGVRVATGFFAAPVEITANVISGNFEAGIEYAGAGSCRVEGNTIGLDAAGAKAVGNFGAGVLASGAPGTLTIGGPAPNQRNVISGNDGDGVHIADLGSAATTSFVIEGNYIGTDASGTRALGNGGNGVYDGFIGDATPGSPDATFVRGNVIAGNARHGVESAGVPTDIEGNLIGTDASGRVPLGNGEAGVYNATDAGDTVRRLVGNTIAANGQTGAISADGVVIVETLGLGLVSVPEAVSGNYIGTSAEGDPLGNVGSGVRLGGILTEGFADVVIGGPAAGDGNTIAYNGEAGVAVGKDTGSTRYGQVRGNAIFGNGALGIDLEASSDSGAGVTPNDADDADSGPNGLLNFPVITSAAAAGATTEVAFTFDGPPAFLGDVTVDFYRSGAPDASGFGEGEVYLGSAVYTPGADGDVSATRSFSTSELPAGSFLTATATSAAEGGTSEFSAAFEVTGTGGTGGITVEVTPTSPAPPVVVAPGAQVFFDVTIAPDADGPSEVELWSIATLPSGNERGPLIGPSPVLLTPGAPTTLSFRQTVPRGAPAGAYVYTVFVGTYPDAVLAQDAFEATVVREETAQALGDDALAPVEAWVVTFADGAPLAEGGPLNASAESGRPAATEAPAASSEALVGTHRVSAVYPNPLREGASVRVEVAEGQHVRAALYDLLGREVAVMLDAHVEPGAPQRIGVEARTLASGTYVLRVVGDDFAHTQRVTVTR